MKKPPIGGRAGKEGVISKVMIEQYFIKVKLKSRSRYAFIARGGIAWLRIHAIHYTLEQAREFAEHLRTQNQDIDIKIVPAR